MTFTTEKASYKKQFKDLCPITQYFSANTFQEHFFENTKTITNITQVYLLRFPNLLHKSQPAHHNRREWKKTSFVSQC